MSAPSGKRFLIPGGGCFGTHYARSLARATDRGRLAPHRLWIVDRDPACRASSLAPREDRKLVTSEWDAFFRSHLSAWDNPGHPAAEDLLVPVHTTTHLFADWLVAALSGRFEVGAVEAGTLPATPHAAPSADTGFTVSFADWVCPVHCIEPYLCPATRQHRSWDIGRALVSHARDLRERQLPGLVGPLLARCTHLVEGVGVVVLGDWLRAARQIAAHAEARECHALIGTVSGCHGTARILSVRARNKKS